MVNIYGYLNDNQSEEYVISKYSNLSVHYYSFDYGVFTFKSALNEDYKYAEVIIQIKLKDTNKSYIPDSFTIKGIFENSKSLNKENVKILIFKLKDMTDEKRLEIIYDLTKEN